MKAAIFTLGDVTFITRFHRNVATLRELGLEVKSFSLRPRGQSQSAPFEGVLIDGWTRRLRGKLFVPLRNAEIVFHFFWAILCYKPDIIFAHNLPALILGWMLCLLRPRTILLYDAMELESGRSPEVKAIVPLFVRIFQRGSLERFLAKRAAVVTSADFARTKVMSGKLGRTDIVTIRNIPRFIEIPRQRLFHEELGLAPDAFIFLYQGLVARGRGMEQAIRSIKGLPEKIILVVMGMCTEGYEKDLRQLAQSIGVSERVFILPPVPSSELLKYTASADVMHSIIENNCLSYYLAAPNKLYEAAMAGTPVIASSFPEMEAVLTKFCYGVLVNPESIEDIRGAILQLYENESLRNEFSRVGLEAARTELNWELESQKLKKAVMDAIKQ